MKKSRKQHPAARYTPFVEWSDEDQCYVGQCPELFYGGVHGADRAAVHVELCQAVEEMVAIIQADGKELPEAVGGGQRTVGERGTGVGERGDRGWPVDSSDTRTPSYTVTSFQGRNPGSRKIAGSFAFGMFLCSRLHKHCSAYKCLSWPRPLARL